MIELVYADPILDIDVSGKCPILKYKKRNGAEDIHIRSKDKEKYTHCYDDLEVGGSYAIISKNVGKKRGRWVWTYAIRMPCEWIPKFRERIAALDPKSPVPGYRVASEDIVMKAVEEVKVLIKLDRDRKQVEKTLKQHNDIIKSLLDWD